MKLRFIVRDGKKILQYSDTEQGYNWQDVPLVEESEE